MIEKNISYSEYLDMVNRINKFSQEKGRMPNYVDICGVRVYKPEYDDAILRVLKFKNSVGRWPNSVLIKGDSLVQKTELWRGLEKSLGKTFDNPEQLAEALRNHPDYEYYYNDKKTPGQTLEALARIGLPGVNCVDLGQIIRQILIDMKIPNVNIWRGRFKCGGHIWVTFGPNNTVFDGAGMMKYGYPIGKYMCSGSPTEVIKNPAWLLSDDAKT